jgi:hypothetical protein
MLHPGEELVLTIAHLSSADPDGRDDAALPEIIEAIA